MRRCVATWSVLLLTAVTGCHSTNFSWLESSRKPDTPPPPGSVPAASLIAYLNDNCSRVQSIRFDDLNVSAKQGLNAPVNVDGVLLAEKPRNFRLKAKVFGSDAIDLGSNNDEFWFWITKGGTPGQIYCSYKDLHEGRVRNLPAAFQPEWIMEAMGLGPYSPAERYKLEADAEHYRLVEHTRSPQGTPIRKVIVMKRREMRAPLPQVTHYLLLDDATNQEICSARILETQLDKATGAILPRKVEIVSAAEKGSLTLRFNGMAVNTPVPQTAFVRTPMQGIESFNLAAMGNNHLQPAGGVR